MEKSRTVLGHQEKPWPQRDTKVSQKQAVKGGQGDVTETLGHPRPCVKCGQSSAALVIRLGDAFCRGCFREYFVHKFRAMLGKNRVIFPGEKQRAWTHLILQTARTRGYTKVMTGESCTRVAIKLLTNLALGRGAFLAVDTGFVDNRHGDVMVVRPMREYMAKEIAFYNHFFDVPTVIAPPLPTKRREKPSIHRLMERFLLGLQEDFPSTISTVYRTGEKLSPAPAKASSESQRCLLCLCALDIAGEEELALEPTLIMEETEPVEDGAESKAAFIPLLCYSCRLTFKELGPLATLPPYVRAEAQRRICRAQMEQQSQEVPLEDEEPSKS
ncbi:PREDICTED: cytoplasmic tRNA 2-thiolation protein 2 [Charadrius vociferus]|uniref:cytoplasmic tRNA 2-thiolation protein 2 n=1 Tax=Charadrius vociferus TaxID=50402 RepID=UPI000521B90A|nr:PREDICTED: cytoplasmic tRNA 2-thiolation protein 2 [Charadrius vociferus]